MLSLFAIVGYTIAALLFLGLVAMLARVSTKVRQTGLFLFAALANAVWAAFSAWQLRYGTLDANSLFVAEIIRSGAWLAFLVSVLSLAGRRQPSSVLMVAAYGAPIAVLLLGILPFSAFDVPGVISSTGSIVLSILVLVILEKIIGSAVPAARESISYLALAIAGLFAYDLVMYSSFVLLGKFEPGLLAARGVANAIVVPLLMIAALQNRNWRVEMFVSRQVGYFSVTMFGVGVYLILMAVGGYYAKEYGGSIGSALASVLVFAAILLLAALLSSERLNRHFRVFFSKHFSRNRYDYRDEWRKLSATLYDPADKRSLGERSIEAAARIMNSNSGYLMLQREGSVSDLLPLAAWHRSLPDHVRIGIDNPLVRYLETSNWIIDTGQFRENPGFYDKLELPGWLLVNDYQQIVVPLLQKNNLIGILVLDQEAPVSLTYEDTDLLKIVGRQVAGLLAQELAAEQLAEGRQFQAYSRLTSFLMHDLKNLAAQQSLVVRNAAQHKRNPEFVDDAFATIEHSVNRMNRLIGQLAERDRKQKREIVSVAEVLVGVIEQVSDRMPVPSTENVPNRVDVLADHEKLAAIFMHVLRNAQDACKKDGRIQASIEAASKFVRIRIADNGEGMDDTFVRERLFKPFVSTKGAGGMGIGAYQVREYVRELRGRVLVDSTPGQGTAMTICLPRIV